MAGGIVLQSAATSGNGAAFNCRGAEGTYTLRVVGTGTITDGVVQWEEARASDYSGTWAPLGPPVVVESGKEVTQTYTGNPLHVRARLATAVAGGGSVTVTVQPPLLNRR